MMSNTPSDSPSSAWYKSLSRYHWFVFVVCCLGWGLDCFDQQVFNIMRNPALADLMKVEATHSGVAVLGGWATAMMLLGWGFGGILFGVMGDKIGRAKTMIITIFFYAIFTGMSGFAVSIWDFFLYRFLCGMGVGGQFAAGVTLLAETMPDKARAKSLGMLQIVAAFCNLCAASLAMFCGFLEGLGFFGEFPVWRFLFLVGFAPALLAFAVMRHLEEPKVWKDAIAAGGVKKAGSIPDLFRHPRWRYNVILGMCLATCGVIGLWGIGFFSIDLTRMAFRETKNTEARQRGDVEKLDFEFIRMLANNPKELLPMAQEKKIVPQNLIGTDSKNNDPGAIYQKFIENNDLNAETVLATVQDSPHRQRWETILASPPQQTDKSAFGQLTTDIAARSKSIGSYVTIWAGVASLLFNLGAVIGTWAITLAAERWGRRIAFTMFFTASFFMTNLVFLKMGTGITFSPEWDVLIMQPLLGFCVLSIFGGYAIYFPELFPTRLRSTAVSFCYNIARFAAAAAPASLGLLTVFYSSYNVAVPLRYAGATMAVTFIFGIIITWFGPETKGQPLPEE
jgi:MFS family permease